VGRNRVKRRLREAVGAHAAALRPGQDLVWIARPPIAAADYGAIVAGVAELLRRARLLRDMSPGPVGPGSERPEARLPRGRPPTGHADSAALTT
jgi:RNase P protein component